MSCEIEKPSFIRPKTPARRVRRSRLHPIKFSTSALEEDRRNVYLRIKPKTGKGNSFVTLDDHTMAPVPNDLLKARKGRFSQRYKFTKIFGPERKQEEVFKETCISPLDNFLHGGNCLVFAYGATNAGKTFTIQGNPGNPGIIPRSLNLLFNSIQGKISKEIKLKPDKISNVLWLRPDEVMKELELKQSILSFNIDKNKVRSTSASSTNSESSQLSTDSLVMCPYFQSMKTNIVDETIELEEDPTNVYSVWVSYAEIYNENIYDLLQVSKPRKPLVMGENSMKEVYIKDLTEVCVFSAEEAFKVFMFGQHSLHQAPTSINHVSSRSHSIFSVKLVRHMKTDCPAFARLSMCTFVDLAGAERAKKTKNAGERMKESQSINTSLHVLGKCFDILRHNQKSREHVTRMLPYRESKLTRLFQRALEGKEVLTMIVNINTDETLFDETLNVLKFSAIAMELQFDQSEDSTFCSLRKSRFSSYMEKLSSSLRSSTEGIEEVPEDARYMKLLAYIEELKRTVEEEKKKNLIIETRIRKEAYTHFRKIMDNMEDMYKQRLNDQKEAYAVYEERVHHMFQSCYEGALKKRSRKSESESGSESDFNSEEEEEDDDSEHKDSEEDIRFLKNKVEALTGLVEAGDQIKEVHNSLQAKYTKLECDLAMVKQELDSALKINEAIGQGEHAKDSVIKELNEQLTDNKKLLKEQNSEIEMLKKLVEDAKEEYIEHFHEHEDFASQNAELEKMLADRDMKLEDLQMQLNICNKKLIQQQQNVDAKEFEEAEYANKLLQACEARDEYRLKVEELESNVKSLQEENAKLRNEPCQNCELRDSQIKPLELLVNSHEDKLKELEQKLKNEEKRNQDLKEEISVLKAQCVCKSLNGYEQEISLLQSEVKETIQSKKELQDRVAKMSKELKDAAESLRLAEMSLTEEQSNTKAMRRIYETKKNEIDQELQHGQTELKKLEEEYGKLLTDSDLLKLHNMELEESLKVKEDELEAFKSRRDAQFDAYENLLKHERELREREQREVHQMQNVMMTHTPQRSEYLISEIKKENSTNFLGDISNKTNDLEDSSHMLMPGNRKLRRRRDENVLQISQDVQLVSSPEIHIKPDPNTRQLRPRRKRDM